MVKTEDLSEQAHETGILQYDPTKPLKYEQQQIRIPFETQSW